MVNEMDLFDPFGQMKKMRRRMFDLFASPAEITGIREPLVDLVDRGKNLEVLAELPGIDKKGIDINVEENLLEIRAKAEKEAKEERKKEGYFFQERSFQSFFRRIPLPTEVVPGKARAKMEKGILKIELPKRHPTPKKKSARLKIE